MWIYGYLYIQKHVTDVDIQLIIYTNKYVTDLDICFFIITIIFKRWK